jgi:serine protease Do
MDDKEIDKINNTSLEKDQQTKVSDVKWETVNDNENKGEIKFKSKKKRKFNGFFKILAVALICAVFGGVGGAIVFNNEYKNMTKTLSGSSLTQQNNSSSLSKMADVSTSAITKTAATVGPAVVGISNKAQGNFGLQDVDSGSGIIFDSKGYIVTNNHVIDNASKITVKLSSGKVLDAKVVGTDARSDLAVIKVDATNLPIAKFGDSSKVSVGDTAIAIGNPLGEEFAGTVTAGIISATNRQINYGGAIYKLIQTDAAINPGNSGGALCNSNGEVIGINSLKLGASENAEGMGFAITINEAKTIISSLMKTGTVIRPYLGILGQDAVSETNNVQGVYVNEIVAGSGAAAAGIKPTDIIVELDGTKVQKFSDLAGIIDKHKIGDKVTCKILRKGKTVSVNVTLTKMKANN